MPDVHRTVCDSEARMADESPRRLREHSPANDALSPGVLQAIAWSQDWLQRVYAHCASSPTCRNEFGTAWRYCVPETRRGDKRVGMCLCRMYASDNR